jgi:VWFA-related protein
MKRDDFGNVAPWILGLVLLISASAGPVFSQDDESTAEEAYVESVDVTVVNVDVYVTDKKGNPITGLTPDDFEVLEDKRPVAITNFYEVRERQRVGPDGISIAPPQEIATLDPLMPTVPKFQSAEQQLNLIVYIDNFNIKPFNRNRVFRRLRGFLREHVKAEDRVMLVTYDRSLHVRQTFTNKPSLINSQLFEIETHSGHGVHHESERRRVYDHIQSSQDVVDAMQQLRPHVESMFNDLQFTITALDDLVESMAGLAGRKALLYVSDGLPMKPGEDLFYMVQQKFHYSQIMTELMQYDASRDFRRLGDRANANRVTFYTIDAGGLRVLTAGTVEMAEAGDAGMSSFVDTIFVQNIQESLKFLADMTGGVAIVNTNDVGKDLERIATDLSTYYSIGYTPAHQGDGRLHRIAVKVKGRKGLRVRHRTSYRDKSIGTQMVDGTLSALRYGFEQNPMGLLIEVGTPTARDDGLYLVPVKVAIPLQSVVLLPRSDFFYGRTQLYFGAIDGEDAVSEVSDLELPIQIPKEQMEAAAKMYYPYETSLLMRSGAHQVAIGVRDVLGAKSSYVTKTFYVGRR